MIHSETQNSKVKMHARVNQCESTACGPASGIFSLLDIKTFMAGKNCLWGTPVKRDFHCEPTIIVYFRTLKLKTFYGFNRE